MLHTFFFFPNESNLLTSFDAGQILLTVDCLHPLHRIYHIPCNLLMGSLPEDYGYPPKQWTYWMIWERTWKYTFAYDCRLLIERFLRINAIIWRSYGQVLFRYEKNLHEKFLISLSLSYLTPIKQTFETKFMITWFRDANNLIDDIFQTYHTLFYLRSVHFQNR